MIKILVVDDEQDLEVLVLQKFRQKIRDKEYEFVFAINGVDALEKLAEHPDIDMVLSDINMPKMDGLTLLGHLNDENPLLKSVIVSAYGDMENIRTAMNRGAFDFITKPINFLDLELTIQKTIGHVLHIRESIKALKENNILKMYVDESVLNFMNSREFEASLTANETIEASVAFIDICRFTAISENFPANVVVNLLNDYFDVIVKEIIAHNGYIDKFIGDAIMAIFRGPDHLENAIKACIAAKQKLQELTHHVEQFSFMPSISIGINSGEMISGNIGSASLRRLDYTVIGDAVNLAQRLQSAAKENQIIINEACYLRAKDSFSCQKVGDVSVKNKANPIAIFEVVG